MRSTAPNKLGKRQHDAMFQPLTTALIAFRLGRAESEHYHEIANAVMIADAVAEIVARHRHLRHDLKTGMNALNSIFDRQKQRTVQDAPWSGTPEEIDALELGSEIYKAVIRTTPGPTISRALIRLGNQIEAAFAE